MDSLTQITLGAAVGEAVLGRRVGNRAMVWGAVGGTLPDLDTVANLFTDPISALAYHRAISHSFLFAVVAPPLLAMLIHRMYDPERKKPWLLPFLGTSVVVIALLTLGGLALPMSFPTALAAGGSVGIAMMLFPLGVGLRQRFRKRPSKNPNASWQGWALLLFAAIATHPLLDSCTTFGTQLFQPFSDYRVAWNNVSVVDPLYTVPFIVCVLLTLRLTRGSVRRRWINILGLTLSTGYLGLTVINKMHVNRVFEQTLAERGIAYQRYMTAPTLLNNILWQATAEGDSSFYFGYYSLFDRKSRFADLKEVPKRHDLLAPYEGDREVEVLQWFANGYYAVEPDPAGGLFFNDLRFGRIQTSAEDPGHYVFQFQLKPRAPNDVDAVQEEASRRNLDGAFEFLWRRMLGR